MLTSSTSNNHHYLFHVQPCTLMNLPLSLSMFRRTTPPSRHCYYYKLPYFQTANCGLRVAQAIESYALESNIPTPINRSISHIRIILSPLSLPPHQHIPPSIPLLFADKHSSDPALWLALSIRALWRRQPRKVALRAPTNQAPNPLTTRHRSSFSPSQQWTPTKATPTQQPAGSASKRSPSSSPPG